MCFIFLTSSSFKGIPFTNWPFKLFSSFLAINNREQVIDFKSAKDNLGCQIKIKHNNKRH